MVAILVEAGGWQQQMETLGINDQDIINILTEVQAQKKKEGK